MRKIIVALAILPLSSSILSVQAFSQTGRSGDAYIKAPPASHKKLPGKLSQTEFAAQAKEFVEKKWASHLAKCGGSFYFTRPEDNSGREVLFEVGDVEYVPDGA